VKRRGFIVLLSCAAAWPLAAAAQQKAMPVLGFLSSASPGGYAPLVAAMRQGLKDMGYEEGQNLTIDFHWAENQNDRLPGLAADLVDRRVDVIAATSMPAAKAAKGATSTIPIVFETGLDPVAAGLVANLARPGGNITGVAMLTAPLMSKRFELLTELVPQASVIGLLVNPATTNAEPMISEAQKVAHTMRVRLEIVKAAKESEIDGAFMTLLQLQAGALVVAPDPLFTGQRERIVERASHHAIPTIYFARELAAAGGLISYGADLNAAFRRLGVYAGKTLKGAKPADLPVEQPTKFELVVNLKTAKTLNLTIPSSVLARADEVIE
jgi:putative ABC transport system substrate-binding protein